MSLISVLFTYIDRDFSASSSAVVMSPFLLRALSLFTDIFDAGYSSLSTKFQAAEDVT